MQQPIESTQPSAQADNKRWHLDLAGKPDFDAAMARIYAWFAQELIDRPPVRFSRHNALYRRRRELASGRDLGEEFLTENHAIMMYQPLLGQPDASP